MKGDIIRHIMSWAGYTPADGREEPVEIIPKLFIDRYWESRPWKPDNRRNRKSPLKIVVVLQEEENRKVDVTVGGDNEGRTVTANVIDEVQRG